MLFGIVLGRNVKRWAGLVNATWVRQMEGSVKGSVVFSGATGQPTCACTDDHRSLPWEGGAQDAEPRCKKENVLCSPKIWLSYMRGFDVVTISFYII